MTGGLGRGGLARCSSTGVLTPYNAQAPHQAGAGASFASNPSLASKRLPSGGGAAPGSTSSGRASESGRGRAASDASDGFRSEALQLEVRLAEGLQALQDAEATEGEDGGTQAASRRLQLCRTLFERIIERDAPFGHLLQRVKREYEAALQAVRGAAPRGTPAIPARLRTRPSSLLELTNGVSILAPRRSQSATPSDTELERCQSELSSTRRQLSQSQKSTKVLEEENAQLRAQLAKLAEREAALREEVSTRSERECAPPAVSVPPGWWWRWGSVGHTRHTPPRRVLPLQHTHKSNRAFVGHHAHRCARSRSTLTICSSTQCSRRRRSRPR